MALHYTALSINTLNTDTTLDIDDVQPQSLIAITHQRTPALESCFLFLFLLKVPLIQVCEPNEQLEDLTSHNFRRYRVTLE